MKMIISLVVTIALVYEDVDHSLKKQHYLNGLF